jgi:hypothetical protein
VEGPTLPADADERDRAVIAPMIQIIALLWMPYEPITSAENWYAPKIEVIQTEPSLEDIELEIIRRQFRIMSIEECNE